MTLEYVTQMEKTSDQNKKKKKWWSDQTLNNRCLLIESEKREREMIEIKPLKANKFFLKIDKTSTLWPQIKRQKCVHMTEFD